MSTVTLDELLPLERAGWDALCSSRGGEFYGGMMTDDAVFVLVDGSALTRDEVVASLDGAPAWDGYEISGARIVEVGKDSAAIVYRARAVRADLPAPFEALMSSVYTVRDGRPRLALYQQTALPR